MKKPKGKPNKKILAENKVKISPEEALQFLEDFRLLASEIDEPTTAISLRVPQNILRALKLKAKADGKKYQSLIIAYIRKGLRET